MGSINLPIRDNLVRLINNKIARLPPYADVAQMVERQTENLCVNGSIPFVGTNKGNSMNAWLEIVKSQKEQIENWTSLCTTYRGSLYQGQKYENSLL